jgi:tetratricopeptide (TPR) repeat protein
MVPTAKSFVLPALLTASLAAAAGAQQQAQCSVDEGKPSQVARALLFVESARSAQAANKSADAAKQLTAAVKALTEAPEKINNANGRNLVLGKALALWLNQPDVGFTPKRGMLGYTTDTESTIDLVAAIDSTFGIVEKAEPGCASATAPFRAQKAWVGLVNSAIEHLNADRADSAEAHAKRAMQLYSAAPYGHMVLGNVAQRRNVDEAIEHYRQGLAVSTDTLYDEAKRSILSAMGNLAADVADSSTAPAGKQKYAAIATEAYDQLLKEFPESQQAGAARSGLARVRLASGDTAGFKATYADQLANPAKYDYQQLLASAVAAARADQNADAAKLFEAALAANPSNRDALYNAALMHYRMNHFEQMLPFVRKLVEVDPSNPDNWQLYTYAYSGMAKALRPAPAKPAAGARRPAAAAKASPAVEAQIKSLNDSTVKYYEMAEKMPVKVEFTEWSNAQDKSTVSGTITNKGSAAKSYSLTLEFLDKAGTVLDTQTVSVADVAPNARGRFSATTAKPGVIAFRYKPVS